MGGVDAHLQHMRHTWQHEKHPLARSWMRSTGTQTTMGRTRAPRSEKHFRANEKQFQQTESGFDDICKEKTSLEKTI